MRIDKLSLKQYKNLQDFEIDFDETSSRQVLVGRNGVGKSNLLEALTRIFRDLDLEEDSGFGYDIDYECNGHFVRIQAHQTNRDECDSDPSVPPKFKRRYWAVDEAECTALSLGAMRPYRQLTESEFFRRNRPIGQQPNPERILPLYVFGYYSGVVSRFAEIFEKHEQKYYKEQITGDEAPLRPLFQAKPNHSQFALLAFYATRDSEAQKFLEEEFRIVGFDSALFSLRQPYWKKPPGTGDPRFWYAGGKVAQFLDSLFTNCYAPMSGKERLKVSVGQEKNKERRYCFLPDQAALQAIAEGLSNKEFFARLESLVFSDLVDGSGADVRIWVRLKERGELATFQDLAEGERQLLTVLGLMRFTADREALFLLDEPDTHLNPAWCLDYLDNLQKYGTQPQNSQVIMTTHSPLTFAGMEKNEVVILKRTSDGIVLAEHPDNAPKGMGFAAILTSDFFGLRSTLDKDTLKKIDDRRELGLKVDKTDDDRRRLQELNTELGRLDFSQTFRDPLYEEFVRAVDAAARENPSLRHAAPPSDIWRKRKEIAKDIAARLLEASSKNDTN